MANIKEENPTIKPVLLAVSFSISFFTAMVALDALGLKSSSPYHWWAFLLIFLALMCVSSYASIQVYKGTNNKAKLGLFFLPWIVGLLLVTQAPESNTGRQNIEIIFVIVMCCHLLIAMISFVCSFWLPKHKVKRETKMTARKELLEKQISAQIERDKQAKNIIEEAKSRISACKNSGSFLE